MLNVDKRDEWETVFRVHGHQATGEINSCRIGSSERWTGVFCMPTTAGSRLCGGTQWRLVMVAWTQQGSCAMTSGIEYYCVNELYLLPYTWLCVCCEYPTQAATQVRQYQGYRGSTRTRQEITWYRVQQAYKKGSNPDDVRDRTGKRRNENEWNTWQIIIDISSAKVLKRGSRGQKGVLLLL